MKIYFYVKSFSRKCLLKTSSILYYLTSNYKHYYVSDKYDDLLNKRVGITDNYYDSRIIIGNNCLY